jgi:hypothetical protein
LHVPVAMNTEAELFAAVIAAHNRGSAQTAASGRQFESLSTAVGAHYKPPGERPSMFDLWLQARQPPWRHQTSKWVCGGCPKSTHQVNAPELPDGRSRRDYFQTQATYTQGATRYMNQGNNAPNFGWERGGNFGFGVLSDCGNSSH